MRPVPVVLRRMALLAQLSVGKKGVVSGGEVGVDKEEEREKGERENEKEEEGRAANDDRDDDAIQLPISLSLSRAPRLALLPFSRTELADRSSELKIKAP